MKFTLDTPADFGFYATVHAHGWRDLAPFQWQETEQTLTRVEHLDSGQVVRLEMREPQPGRLEIETDADKADEAEIIRRVRRIFQLDKEISGFHAFCASRPELAPIPPKKQGRVLRAPTLWEDAVKVILTTNTTWSQTQSMTRRLVAEWGAAHVSSPEIRAFPLPQRIAALNFAHFANLAKVGYRAAALHELAALAAEPDFEAWNDCDLTTDALRKKLLGLRGIGPYAAACLLLYLGRPDRVNSDSWARTLVGREMGRPVSDAEVHAFFADYGAWRGLVYAFYPWRETEDPA